MLFYLYSDSTGSITDITSRCRVGRLSVKDQAEEGAVAISSLIIDDPDGDIEFTGHRRIYIYESEAPAFDQVVFNGFTVNERVERGPYRTEEGRQWVVDLADPNVFINRRIMNGADANRPAETDIARLTALLAMTELNTVDDELYFNLSATATSMDAADYRGQNVGAYIDDLRQATGKNGYIWYREATGQYSIWYDFASSSAYSSGKTLSNNLGLIDNSTVFGYSQERTYLNRDPSRVASGIYLEYAGGTVYVQDAGTITDFAAIDWAAPSINVKTLTKATARANRYLADADSEHEIIHTVMVNVPRAKVNNIKKGQLVLFQATHLPGYESPRTCRILYRTLNEISEDPQASFEIEMDLDPQPVQCPSATATQTIPPLLNGSESSGIVYGDAAGLLQYLRPGIAGIRVPTPFNYGRWHFPEFDLGGIDYAGDCAGNKLRICVVGAGTLTIPMTAAGGDDRITAKLYHYESGVGDVLDETQGPVADGSTFVFNITTDEETICSHWVEIERYDGPCGDYQFGYGPVGASWVLS